MKLQLLVLYTFILCLFSSFGQIRDCEYAGSNIEYIANEIRNSLAEKDLQLTRFHLYKALDAISKSKEKLEKCDCGPASQNVAEVAELLKNATKTRSLAGIRILLGKALPITADAFTALKEHEQHKSDYGTDELSLNTTTEKKGKLRIPPNKKLLEQKIDSALLKYRASMKQVISTVDCSEARKFADRILQNCEQELLRTDLSEGKKYYNLRTKEITAEALVKLGDCGVE